MKRRILLTPGPTPLPGRVRAALSRPVLHHRTEEFRAVFDEVLRGMRYAFRTENDVLMLTATGTGAMESAVANLLSPGDKALVHSAGAFGERFVSILKAYGLEPLVVSEEWGRAADPEKLRAALKANPDVKAVFFQHVETSTGVVNDVQKLADCVREHSPAIIVVDSVSGLAGDPLQTDSWHLDVVLTASQKGFMNAPGLAFASVSERAWKRVEQAKLPRFYFDWRKARKSFATQETPFTPGVSLVVAQAEALRLIREQGIENVWKRTASLAAYARARARELGLPLFAEKPANIVTALRLPEGVDGVKLLADIREEDGISIAGGQGRLKGKIVRLAHMGHIGKADLAAGFKALSKRLDGGNPKGL